MQTKNLIICKEIREYYHDVENLVSDLDYVMFLNNKIIGQIIFMKALIKTDEGRNLDVMTIGPISIANDFKRQ